MASDQVDKVRKKHTENLIKEAEDYLVGKPNFWSEKLGGDEVKFGEQFGAMLKAGMPFMTGQLRTDLLIFHLFPTKFAKCVAVFNYSRHILLPIEYMALIDGKIPYAALLKRGALGSGSWHSAHGDERDGKDSFSKYLSEIKKSRMSYFSFSAKWDQKIGSKKIKLDWAMQLVPVSPNQYVFIFKFPFNPGFMSASYGFEKMMELVPWLKEEVDKFNYQDNQETPAILAQSYCFLALKKLMGV